MLRIPWLWYPRGQLALDWSKPVQHWVLLAFVCTFGHKSPTSPWQTVHISYPSHCELLTSKCQAENTPNDPLKQHGKFLLKINGQWKASAKLMPFVVSPWSPTTKQIHTILGLKVWPWRSSPMYTSLLGWDSRLRWDITPSIASTKSSLNLTQKKMVCLQTCMNYHWVRHTFTNIIDLDGF